MESSSKSAIKDCSHSADPFCILYYTTCKQSNALCAVTPRSCECKNSFILLLYFIQHVWETYFRVFSTSLVPLFDVQHCTKRVQYAFLLSVSCLTTIVCLHLKLLRVDSIWVIYWCSFYVYTFYGIFTIFQTSLY